MTCAGVTEEAPKIGAMFEFCLSQAADGAKPTSERALGVVAHAESRVSQQGARPDRFRHT